MLDLPQVVPGYKARPHEGVWATPPFLHNGSVPNLYQLLSPVSERSKRFFVGRREFDPVKVGLVTEPIAGSTSGFWYKTHPSPETGTPAMSSGRGTFHSTKANRPPRNIKAGPSVPRSHMTNAWI